MNIDRNYIIMTPFNLPWKYVSPYNYRGLEYHLTPDLSIVFERMQSSTIKVDEQGDPIGETRDMEFLVGEEIFLTYDENHFEGAGGLNGEKVFKNEIMPLKSQQRIDKAFADKSETLSCFFTEKQMAHFEYAFETNYLLCHEVSVLFNGKYVTDIAELPKKEFKMVLEAFEELNVQATLDYRKSKKEIEEAYSEYFQEHVAERDEEQRRKVWDRVKQRDTRKKILKTVGAMALGTVSWVLKKRLAESGGWITGVASVLIGVIGVGFEMYGRHEAGTILRLFEGGTFR